MKPNPRDRLVAGSFITITLDKFVIQGLNSRHILAHQYLCDVTKLREVLSHTLGSCLPGKTTDEHFARIVGDLLAKDTQVERRQRREETSLFKNRRRHLQMLPLGKNWENHNHSCYRDAWKSTVYNVKTVSTDISGNIHRKCPIIFPGLYLPDWMTTKTIHHCPIT